MEDDGRRHGEETGKIGRGYNVYNELEGRLSRSEYEHVKGGMLS